MTVLSGDSLRERSMIEPFCERSKAHGMTYGVGFAGYDIRVREAIDLPPGGFSLASTVEAFDMDNDVIGVVHDKSTWARRGLAVQNTVLEPGWVGYLTLELTNHTRAAGGGSSGSRGASASVGPRRLADRAGSVPSARSRCREGLHGQVSAPDGRAAAGDP